MKHSLNDCKGPEELKGISLGYETAWVVEGVSTPSKFFAALAQILPQKSNLYFEGTTICDETCLFLEKVKIEPTVPVQGGTICPRPKIFHVNASSQNLDGLSKLAENRPGPEICDHFHVYHESWVTLQWFDAWYDPIGLASDFSEDDVRKFCELMREGTFRRFDSKNF